MKQVKFALLAGAIICAILGENLISAGFIAASLLLGMMYPDKEYIEVPKIIKEEPQTRNLEMFQAGWKLSRTGLDLYIDDKDPSVLWVVSKIDDPINRRKSLIPAFYVTEQGGIQRNSLD